MGQRSPRDRASFTIAPSRLECAVAPDGTTAPKKLCSSPATWYANQSTMPARLEIAGMTRHLPFALGLSAFVLVSTGAPSAAEAPKAAPAPLYPRHVQAVFSRLGCNGGTCHGAVKGQNGFKL